MSEATRKITTVILDPASVETLKQLAEAEDRSRSYVVRRLIQQAGVGAGILETIPAYRAQPSKGPKP